MLLISLSLVVSARSQRSSFHSPQLSPLGPSAPHFTLLSCLRSVPALLISLSPVVFAWSQRSSFHFPYLSPLERERGFCGEVRKKTEKRLVDKRESNGAFMLSPVFLGTFTSFSSPSLPLRKELLAFHFLIFIFVCFNPYSTTRKGLPFLFLFCDLP